MAGHFDAVAAKARLPRAPIILTVYAALIVDVLVVGYVIVPSYVKEVHQLSNDAP